MSYPSDVLTKSKSGKIEARIFMRRGKFVEYSYKDMETGRVDGKRKLMLKTADGSIESYFIIPLKNKDRYLLMKDKDADENIKIWDGKKAIGIWDK